MYILGFPHDSETPDEYRSTNPVLCSFCGSEYDSDEDLNDKILYDSETDSYICWECIFNSKKEVN